LPPFLCPNSPGPCPTTDSHRRRPLELAWIGMSRIPCLAQRQDDRQPSGRQPRLKQWAWNFMITVAAGRVGCSVHRLSAPDMGVNERGESPRCGNTVVRPSDHGRQDGPSTRPKQLRDREVPWEGSHRSKRMSRRTERPYQVDGAGELAPHSAAPSSAPEINGPAVPREFTFLLREICSRGSPATAGTVASNGHRPGAEVSRGRSTGEHEPGAVRPVETKKPEGLTTREGLNLAGSSDHRGSCPSVDAGWLS